MQTSINKIFNRSFGEKLISFSIFLMIGLSFESIILFISSYCNWNFIENKWLFKTLYIPLYYSYFILQSISSFTLWKSFTFKKLKLEMSLFFGLYLLSILWNFAFLIKHNYFISLIISLFILFFSIILNLLIWKKEKIAAIIVFISTLWILYLFILNMSASITSY